MQTLMINVIQLSFTLFILFGFTRQAQYFVGNSKIQVTAHSLCEVTKQCIFRDEIQTYEFTSEKCTLYKYCLGNHVCCTACMGLLDDDIDGEASLLSSNQMHWFYSRYPTKQGKYKIAPELKANISFDYVNASTRLSYPAILTSLTSIHICVLVLFLVANIIRYIIADSELTESPTISKTTSTVLLICSIGCIISIPILLSTILYLSTRAIQQDRKFYKHCSVSFFVEFSVFFFFCISIYFSMSKLHFISLPFFPLD